MVPLHLFRRMFTQRIFGPNGRVIGLRYESLPFVLRSLRVPAADWPEVMDCFQIMENHMVKLLGEIDHA